VCQQQDIAFTRNGQRQPTLLKQCGELLKRELLVMVDIGGVKLDTDSILTSSKAGE
jgi:hypothetical protein